MTTTNTDIPSEDEYHRNYSEEDWVSDVILHICELADRDSPEDFPEAMVVTPDELRNAIARYLPRSNREHSSKEVARYQHLREHGVILFEGKSLVFGAQLDRIVDASIEASDPKQPPCTNEFVAEGCEQFPPKPAELPVQGEAVAVMFNSFGEIGFDTDLTNYELLPHPQHVNKTNSKDWSIDTSTGREILMYKDCSVIEDEQARYLLWLIHATPTLKPSVNAPTDNAKLIGALNKVIADLKFESDEFTTVGDSKRADGIDIAIKTIQQALSDYHAQSKEQP